MNITEKLIELVRPNPCLYDSRNPEYKNSYNREILWNKIAKELGHTREATKIKWKNLKDGYTKYRKQSQDPNCEKKNYVNWIWGPQLTFLDSSVRHRVKPKLEPVEDSQASASNSPSHEMKYEPEIHYETEMIYPMKRSASDEDLGDIPDYFKKRKADATDLLFASYAETFKKFRPGTQTSVKLKLAQIFADAEMMDMEHPTVIVVEAPPP